MNHVILNDTVEDVATDEAEVTINGGSCALDESPVLGFVVRGLGVSVVKVSDGNCK